MSFGCRLLRVRSSFSHVLKLNVASLRFVFKENQFADIVTSEDTN